MHTPFPFEALLIFGAMGVMLLVGVLLRATVPFFQRFLIPSSLIGGLLGLIVLSSGLVALPSAQFETFAYHLFIISFISVGLTHTSHLKNGSTEKVRLLGAPVWMGLIEGVTISLQALIGCLFVLLFGLMGTRLFPTFGLLIPLGFTEGPGQALSIGKTWEGFGFAHAATIGLTFATLGFFFAFFVGVPLVNWGIKHGRRANGPAKLSADLLKGLPKPGQAKESAGELTTHTGNIETLAFQMALVGLVYIITYLLIRLLENVLPPDMAATFWGFFFFFAMVVALLVRGIMVKLKVIHLVDPGIQRRITGWSVDFLIVATVMAIQVAIVWEYIVPILVMSLVSGVLTTWIVLYLGNRLDNYNLERTAAIYGTVTGTLPSGLLLLRIVDPEMKTPVALEIGLMNLFAAPIIVLSMLLVNGPVWWDWSMGVTVLVFVALMLVSLALIKIFGFWGKRRY
jgi:ESS family glutamate:Na+ symporter